jgi:tungstate transport system ATP-binding protein
MTVVYQVQNLEHRYKKRTILSIPDLTINSNEVFALVGPSGAGKSTLLRLLAMLERPTSGNVAVSLDDRTFDFNTATIQQRRQVAMVFQRPLLLSRNVRANVAFGLRIRGRRKNRAIVQRALERVALAHLARANARTLSGGEMQRVAVARALVIEPSVLILDEPTANLDPYNVRIIEDLIRSQHEEHNTTIIMVTHNIFQAQRLATRVALILEGRLVEVASNHDFFNNPQDPRTAAFVSGDLIY